MAEKVLDVPAGRAHDTYMTNDTNPVTRFTHLSVAASHVRCGAPMRDRNRQDGWDLGTSTLDPTKVTCPACRTGRKWTTLQVGEIRKALA